MSSNTRKQKIMEQIDQLIIRIRGRLKGSALLTAHKKLAPLPQPKSLAGGQLKDYQLQSLAWMVELANNGLSGILADDMGLGKTIQTIAYLTHVHESKGVKGKHLIVVPKNVLNNWKRELQKWNPKFQAIILPGTEAERQECLGKYVKPSKFDILIATYQSVQYCERALRKFKWQALIIDQAHSIKNDQTCLASCLRRLNSRFSLLLTGTPLSNQLKQLWSLLNFIVPDIFSDNELFTKIEGSVNQQCKDEQQKIKYQSEIATRFKAIISPFMLRRVKSQINLGLKEKKQFTLFVSLTELQLKMYRNYLKFGSVYGDDDRKILGKQVQLRKICAHPYVFSEIQDPKAPPYGQHLIENCGKLKLLDKLLTKLLKQNHKILIFSQFVIFLKILEDYCIYRQHKYALITGQTSLEGRDENVQEFSKSKDINIFLISTRAGGLGLNLVAADVVILYDIDWNPQIDKQATDRAYRIGQKNNVLVFRFITNNTIQQRILEVQKYKLIWDQLVIQKGGLAKIKAAEERFEKIDHNHIAGIGAEEIFKLQQNYDDKTIEQIINIGLQKDHKKTEQIRKKLQKQLQTYGEIENPYQVFQKAGSTLKNIDYKAQNLGVQKAKASKLNWKQRQGFRYKQVQLKPFHLYSDTKKAGQILLQLQQQQQLSQQRKAELLKNINQLGFYSWQQSEYKRFIEANLTHLATDYKQIAEQVKTKSAEQVQKYSNKFMIQARHNNTLSKDYKRIIKKQQQMLKCSQLEMLQRKIVQTPEQVFYYKPKSARNLITDDSVLRLFYNGIKKNGVCFQEYQEMLEKFIPSAVAKITRNFSSNNQKIKAYQKAIQSSNQTNREEVQQKMQQRYKAIIKKYGISEQSDKETKQKKQSKQKLNENNYKKTRSQKQKYQNKSKISQDISEDTHSAKTEIKS